MIFCIVSETWNRSEENKWIHLFCILLKWSDSYHIQALFTCTGTSSDQKLPNNQDFLIGKNITFVCFSTLSACGCFDLKQLISTIYRLELPLMFSSWLGIFCVLCKIVILCRIYFRCISYHIISIWCNEVDRKSGLSSMFLTALTQ